MRGKKTDWVGLVCFIIFIVVMATIVIGSLLVLAITTLGLWYGILALLGLITFFAIMVRAVMFIEEKARK